LLTLQLIPTIPLPEEIKEGIIKALNDKNTGYSAAQGESSLLEALSADMKSNFGLQYPPNCFVILPVHLSLPFRAIPHLNLFFSNNNRDQKMRYSRRQWFFFRLSRNGNWLCVSVQHTKHSRAFLFSFRDASLSLWQPMKSIHSRFFCFFLCCIHAQKKKRFFPNLRELEYVLKERHEEIGAIYLNSPNNPSGAFYDEDFLIRFSELLKQYPKVPIISDEVYRTIVYDGKAPLRSEEEKSFLFLFFQFFPITTPFTRSLFHPFQKKKKSVAKYLPEQTLVVGGMSKEVAGTGLRIGFVAGPAHAIAAITKLQGNTSAVTATPIQLGYAHFLRVDSDAHIRRALCQKLEKKRNLLLEQFSTLTALKRIYSDPPAGAFYYFPSILPLIGLKTENEEILVSDEEVCTYLLQKSGAVMLPGSKFGKPGYVRIAYGRPTETEIVEGCRSLNETLTKLFQINGL
jgi:aspartate/methionine/tyrosine aminotransferase